MISTLTLTLERFVVAKSRGVQGDSPFLQTGGEWIEDEYEIEFEYSPLVPARTAGPPELCHPSEGAEVDICGVRWKLACEGEWMEIDVDEFLLHYVKYHRLEDDPKDKRYRRTAIVKAREAIEEDCYGEGLELHIDLQAAAGDAAYDRWKDEGML